MLKEARKEIRIGSYKVDTLYVYEGDAKRLFLQYKEGKDILLHTIFLERIAWRLKWRYRNHTIISAPSHMHTIQERGFHVVQEMFREVFPNLKTDVFQKKEAFRQARFGRIERMNIAERIEVNWQHVKAPKKVLLIDDMITTGATIQTMAETLTEFGCIVSVFVVYRHKSLEMDG